VNGVERLTRTVGLTLLYPLTILSLLFLSRLRLFDNWNMTPSLVITFMVGAVILIVSSLLIVSSGRRLVALLKNILSYNAGKARQEGKADEDRSWEEELKRLDTIREGAFARWYQQPIFIAIFSVGTVLATAGLVEPLFGLFFR
jgi:hypothetical protein